MISFLQVAYSTDYVYKTRDLAERNYRLDAYGKTMISHNFKEAVKWLDANKNGEVHEYEYKRSSSLKQSAIDSMFLVVEELRLMKFNKLHRLKLFTVS